jgi:hypothetical protein
MAIDGDLYSLRKKSILELLAIYISPGGFIEKLDIIIGSDTNYTETTLVR